MNTYNNPNNQNNFYNNEYDYNNIQIKRNKIQINKGLLFVLTILMIYISFLLIGAFDTKYKINEYGSKEAVVANLSTRDAREDYDKLKIYYVNLSKLLENCDSYEYEMEKNLTPYFTLSTKYSDILVSIDRDMTKLSGLDINSKYDSLHRQLYESYNYFAVYCQKMNAALLNDNYSSYQESITWKNTTEQNLENVRQNFIAFGEDYAKIFNDKDLEKSRLEKEEIVAMTPTPTPTISTGAYGEDTQIETTPTPKGQLGSGRLDTKKDITQENSKQDTTNNNSQENAQQDVISNDTTNKATSTQHNNETTTIEIKNPYK